MASTLKASYGGNMKRLNYGSEEEVTDFGSLVKAVKKFFIIPEAATLRIVYKDQDGDKVLLSDDADLTDAVKVQKLNPLYLDVTIINQAQPASTPAIAAAAGASPADPLAGIIGEGNERLRKYLSNLPQGPDTIKGLLQGPNALKGLLQSFDPAATSGYADIVEKVLSGVSSSLAAAAAASAAASQSKPQEETHSKTQETTVEQTKTAEHTQPAKRDADIDTSSQKETKKEKEPEKTAPKVEAADNTNESLHSGVQCDICSMIPIKGTRFKSMEQHDYDLCQSCMDAYPKKEEQFTKIEHPLYRPRHHGRSFGGACRPGFFGGRPYNPPGCPAGPFNPAAVSGGAPRWGGHGFRSQWNGCNSSEAKPDARFVKDVTIYDGTEMVPGTSFTKIWRFRNTGTSTWPQGTRIVNVGGDKLSEQESFALQIGDTGLAPGEEVDVAASLTAPEKPGRYVTHFRLATPQGVKYGHRMWALIHVLDQDEESPLVADSKADEEVVKPASPTEPAPEKEAAPEAATTDVENADVRKAKATDVVKATNEVTATNEGNTTDVVKATNEMKATNDVKEVPVEGADSAAEDVQVVAIPESPKTEPTNLGDDGFMKVEQADTKSTEDAAPEETVNQNPVVETNAAPVEAPVSPAAMDAPKPTDTAKALSESSVESAQQAAPVAEASDKAPESELYKSQLAKLAELGFSDAAQNVALLEKYEGDLPKTINDLVTANEWDPMMQELEEMGFYDKELNRSLIYKNNGRLQRVVKDLVQIYKAGTKA